MEKSRATVADQAAAAATIQGNGGKTSTTAPFIANALDELRALKQEHQNLQRALAIHDELTRLALDGAGFSRLARALSELVGNPVLIESRFFRALAYAWPTGAPPRDERSVSLRTHRKDAGARLLWSRLQNDREPVLFPPAREHGVSWARAVSPVVISGDIVGYVSIIGRDRPLDSVDLPLIQQASLAVSMVFLRHQAEIDAELRFKGDVLDVVLQSADVSPEVRATRSALFAYDCNATQTLLLVAPVIPDGDRPPSLHDLTGVIASWARRVASGSLVAERDGQIVVLLSGELPKPPPRAHTSSGNGATQSLASHGPGFSLDAAQLELTDSLRREVASYLSDVNLSISIAPSVRDSRELRDVYAVARRALSILELLGQSGQAISISDPRLAVFLLFDSTKPDTRREFVDLVLGPLIAYDQRGHRALVETLKTYLDCGGNLETTARTLNVHTSTLKYRLQRIAAVSGLDVHNADHRFNAALAVRLRTLVRDEGSGTRD